LTGKINKTPLDIDRLNEITREWPLAERQLLDIYVSEASTFFPVISTDLENLGRNSIVKEVGSGIGLLTLLVAEQGFRVFSFEPESAGFSLMTQFQSTVRSVWCRGPVSVEWIDEKYTASTSATGRADFIFAVNVIEHVPDWQVLVNEIVLSEKPDLKLRLIFPNYLYPYEPHFQIPTLFNKRLTKFVISKKIKNSWIIDPISFWEDLSWPTGSQVKKHCKEMGYGCSFSNEAFSSYLKRFQVDRSFRERKGRIFTGFVKVFLPALSYFANWLPGRFLPVIDVTITRDF